MVGGMTAVARLPLLTVDVEIGVTEACLLLRASAAVPTSDCAPLATTFQAGTLWCLPAFPARNAGLETIRPVSLGEVGVLLEEWGL